MTWLSERSLGGRAIFAARLGSATTCVAGLLVVAGWLLHVPSLTYLAPLGPAIKTNAGLLLAAAGLANLCLLARHRAQAYARTGWGLASFVALTGAATVVEHATGWDLGIDQLLAVEAPGALATTSPNRMGLPGSVTFVLLGVSLLLLDRRSFRLRRWGLAASLLAALVALLPLTGFAYGLTDWWQVAQYSGIALITAVMLFVQAASQLAGRPDIGLARLFCRDDESGQMVRRLFGVAVVFTFLVGWVLAQALHAGVSDGAFAVTAMSVALVVGLTALIWWTGEALGRALDQRATIAEALAQSAASLRASDEQKTAFLATLSHELRNPLAPIQAAVQLLDGPPATAQRARQIIGRQAAHLVRLVDDLLDLTRITHGKLRLQRRMVDVRQILRDAIEALADETARARHVLTVDAPAAPLWVHADPDRLVQVVVNLLGNAVRYTPPGGRITVRTSADDRSVTLVVTDSGRGIAAEDLDRVFDMFVQVGESRHGGLGIGLALVKRLVVLHGGTIEARSAGTGLGAEFRLCLPRVAADGDRREAALEAPIDRVLRRVLIVDDNADAADALGQVLADRGHVVDVVYSGEEALSRLSMRRHEVGLFDLGLPGMDGLDLARHVRADPATSGMLLVAITGRGHEDDRRRTEAAGFDAHFTKPATLEALFALVEAPDVPVRARITGSSSAV